MKRKLLLLLITVLASSNFYAQCIRSGTFVANSPDTNTYPISGTANITQENDGSKSVNFESDFVSVQGFQLQVFLSKTQTINSDVPNPSIYMRVDADGDLLDDEHNATPGNGHDGHVMTGAKVFTQNLSGVDINEYQYIILQCTQFNVPWGYANLGADIDCSSLSLNETTLESSLNLFPNPFKNNLTLESKNLQHLKVQIFDVLGKQVFYSENKGLKNQNINLTSLKSGVYLVKITADNQTTTKRLIKQ